jgi:hypothetical protein
MMQSIDSKHSVVDLTSHNEIKNVKEADPDTGLVVIVTPTYGGKVTETRHFPGGIRIIRRP